MKKLLIIVLTIMWAAGLHAQAPKTWFDGDAYFTESFPGGGILYYTGTSADKEYDFSFGLEPMIDGSFKLVKCTDTDKIPFRAEWGTSVRRYVQGSIDVYLIEGPSGEIVWTLQRTSQTHQDALANQLWIKDRPLDQLLSSTVLNTHYLSEFSKTELRSLAEFISQKQYTNPIEKINLSLINSELGVADYDRYYVGDIQMIEDASRSRVYYVDSAISFLKALKSGATICIKPNTVINLSDALNTSENFKGMDYDWVDDMWEYDGDGKIISEAVHNGRQLTIRNIHDLTIVGDYNTHILVDPAYAYVLNFVNCNNLKIENLTMGHTVEGYCTGGVVGLQGCNKVSISYSDLYGCGAYGIVAEKSSGIEMYHSIIHDCSYGIMQLFDVKDAYFSSCDFVRNREFLMLEVDSQCREIEFSDCRFAQNQGVLFPAEGRMKFENCVIYHPEGGQLHSGEFHDKSLIQMDESTEVKITNMPLGKRPVGPDSKFMN